jgi:hypothetical protein
MDAATSWFNKTGCIAGPIHFSREQSMDIHLTLVPLVALIAGILILIIPRLLNYIIALYLIIIGVVGLFGTSFHLH